MNKRRFIAGLILVIGSAILTLTAGPEHNHVTHMGLGVIGIILIATAKKKTKQPETKQD